MLLLGKYDRNNRPERLISFSGDIATTFSRGVANRAIVVDSMLPTVDATVLEPIRVDTKVWVTSFYSRIWSGFVLNSDWDNINIESIDKKAENNYAQVLSEAYAFLTTLIGHLFLLHVGQHEPIDNMRLNDVSYVKDKVMRAEIALQFEEVFRPTINTADISISRRTSGSTRPNEAVEDPQQAKKEVSDLIVDIAQWMSSKESKAP